MAAPPGALLCKMSDDCAQMMDMTSTDQPAAFGRGRLAQWQFAASAEAWTTRLPDIAPDDPDADLIVEQAANGIVLMTFVDVAIFQVDLAARVVTLTHTHPDADRATIDHLLNDHIAPRVIAQSGALVLHGSAVEIGGSLAIFLGQTGAGKSTLAASLYRSGHRLLGDDAVVIDEAAHGFEGEAVYRSLRLFPESIEHVLIDPVATAPMAYYSSKLLVDAGQGPHTGPDSVPIGGIFALAVGDEGVSHAPLKPADACMMLVENSFALDPADPLAAAGRMAKAARLAAAVPCQSLAYPSEFGILPAVGEHVAQLLATSRAGQTRAAGKRK